MIYAFADCVLDMQLCVLHRAQEAIPLRPKVLQVLYYLLMHRDRVVTKQELCEQVWATSFVSDAAWANCIKAVRQVVGDRGWAQQIIQTRRGHGYRFIAAVTPSPGNPSQHRLALPSIHAKPPPVSTREEMQPVENGASMQRMPSWWPPRASGEWKAVTLLCCRFVSPATCDMRGRREAGPPLWPMLYPLVRRVAQRYEGGLQPLGGTSILMIFGAPVAQEDHACRAVLGALDLSQDVGPLSEARAMPHAAALTVRMGLHTGLMAMGGGEEEPATTEANEHLVSLAIALQEQAVSGQILCSTSTAALVRQVVHLTAVPALHVSAQATPVGAFQVVGRAPRLLAVGSHIIVGTRALVGRAHELATLQALWTKAKTGHGQVIGLVGDPGIGKSRLVEEFCRQLQGTCYTAVAGRCLSYGQLTPYLPVLELLRHVCGLTETESPATVVMKVHQCLRAVGMHAEAAAPYLLHLLRVPSGTDGLCTLSPETVKDRTFEILRQFCFSVSQGCPLLIVLEDLQWIDATSEAWLASLIEHLAGVPILLLLTYRPGYRPPRMAKSYATQLAVGPLPPHDCRELVRTALPPLSASKGLIDKIVARADGNPFFLEELCRAVVEQQGDQATRIVPDTIQMVLAARIDRLPTLAKHVLQAAAVIGTEVPVPLLQTITTLSEAELQQSLLDLYTAEFLYEVRVLPSHVVRFTHVLTRDVAYQTLLPGTRQHTHQQIAYTLTTLYRETAATQPELVAHHYMAAGCTALAVPYWHQAGQHAVEHSAYPEAITHLSKGLEVLATLPETAERHRHELQLHMTLGPALMAMQGQRATDVERTYTRAHALCQQVGDSQQLFPVLMGLWRFHIARKAFQSARELAKQLLRLAHRLRDPALRLEAHQAMGISCYFLRAFVPARYHLEQGIALYDPQRCRTQAALYLHDAGVMCRSFAALVLWLLGYPEQALEQSHEALTLGHSVAHPATLAHALMRAAELHGHCREAQKTLEWANEAIMLVTQHHFAPWYLAPLLILRGWSLAQHGQMEEGVAQIHQGLAAYRAAGREDVQPYHLVYLAEAYARSGQTQAGLDVLTEAFGAKYSTGPRPADTWLYRLKGDLLMHAGDRRHLVEAEACLRRALTIARHQYAKSRELQAAMSLSRLWQQEGRRADACTLLAETYAWFTEGFDTADLQEARALLEELRG